MALFFLARARPLPRHCCDNGNSLLQYPLFFTITIPSKVTSLLKIEESIMHHDPLFCPLRLGQLHLANRIVMPPMTRSRACRAI